MSPKIESALGTYHHYHDQVLSQCVVPENIHIPTTEGIGNSRGVGGSKAQEIPERRGGC